MGSKNRTALRNSLEYGAFLVARAAARSMGARLLAAIAAMIGDVYHVLDRERRRVLESNLRLAFPELNSDERNQLARQVGRHFACVSLDMLRLRGCAPEELLADVTVVGEENLDRALALDRGVILMSAHIGFWEISALIAGLQLPGGVAVVNRPLDNPRLEEELDAFRSRFGNVALGKKRVTRALLERLKNRQAIGIMIDQRSRERGGAKVPFFGHPVWTHDVLARLMLRTEAPLVPLWCFRDAPRRYTVRYDAPLTAMDFEPERRNVEALTAEFNLIVENIIREHPEQWLWYHDRWREVHLVESDDPPDGGAKPSKER